MIVSISTVKNEEDIIESFIRYNCQYLDKMFIIDNESSDRTVEIIKSLILEGYPVELTHDHSVEHSQDNKLNMLMKYVFNEHNPKVVVPIDADEFLISEDMQTNPKEILNSLDSRAVYYMKWKTYVPTKVDNTTIEFIPERITYCRQAQHEQYYKVIVPNTAYEYFNISLTMGNHDISCTNNSSEINRLSINHLKLAHFPVRSKEQLMSKIMVGWINSLSKHNRQSTEAYHWRGIFEKIKTNNTIEDSDYYSIAENYAMVDSHNDIDLVYDPIHLERNIQLRYSNSNVNALSNFIQNTELLAINYAKIKRPAPDTSIIILTHNQLQYTQLCIESIRTYTEMGTYEIIIVDNNSTDGTIEWLKEQTDVSVIYNNHNAGFPAACNQGIKIARGKYIALLNNDTVVTSNWLNNLLYALNSSNDIGAVGPVTNSASYYQTIPTTYESIEQMLQFSSEYNIRNPLKWEYRLKLIGFCMIIKRDVIDKIGMLDERFTPGNFEDDDYSFRIINEGYKLILCKDTFIHHFGGTSFKQYSDQYRALLETNQSKFIDKWGFNPGYSSFIRFEIINLIDSPPLEPIRVLEVGCACGGTLLEIKNRYPNAELFGIELNTNSAKIAGTFANIKDQDVEKNLSYPEKYFDYIIFADVLEHLLNPWDVVKNTKKYLKDNGKLLVSLPNIMHHSIFRSLLEGNWTYENAGLLDRTHLRFFTKNEMIKMFQSAGYSHVLYKANVLPGTEADNELIEHLAHISSNSSFIEETKAYQYIFKISNNNKYTHIETTIKDFSDNPLDLQLTEQLANLISVDNELYSMTRAKIKSYFNAEDLLNHLAITLYNQRQYDLVLPLLQDALDLNKKNDNTLYNIGYVLYQVGEYELARNYLEKIQEKDEEVLRMINSVVPNNY